MCRKCTEVGASVTATGEINTHIKPLKLRKHRFVVLLSSSKVTYVAGVFSVCRVIKERSRFVLIGLSIKMCDIGINISKWFETKNKMIFMQLHICAQRNKSECMQIGTYLHLDNNIVLGLYIL